MWLKTDDSGHIWIVGAYYKYSAAWSVKAVDISPGGEAINVRGAGREIIE